MLASWNVPRTTKADFEWFGYPRSKQTDPMNEEERRESWHCHHPNWWRLQHPPLPSLPPRQLPSCFLPSLPFQIPNSNSNIPEKKNQTAKPTSITIYNDWLTWPQVWVRVRVWVWVFQNPPDRYHTIIHHSPLPQLVEFNLDHSNGGPHDTILKLAQPSSTFSFVDINKSLFFF